MNEFKVTYNLHAWLSEKLIVFSRPKIATRLLDTYFNLRNAYDVQFVLNKEGFEIKQVIHQQRGLQDDEETKLIFENILSGKEKRDILIFYREPYARMISGLYQEFLTASSNPELFYFWGRNISNKGEVFQALRHATNATFTFKHTSLDKDVLASIKEMAQDYVKFVSQNNLNMTHTDNHLMAYNLLFSMSKVNSSKIKIINTEDYDAELYLKPYFDKKVFTNQDDFFRDDEGSILRTQFSNSEIKGIVRDVIRGNDLLDSMNTPQRLIEQFLKPEETMYFYLENHPRNVKILEAPVNASKVIQQEIATTKKTTTTTTKKTKK